MDYVFYTYSRSTLLPSIVQTFASSISTTKGRKPVTVTIIRKSYPRTAKTMKDSDGDVVLDWQWLRERFPRGTYHGVIVHLSPAHRKQYRLPSKINGVRNRNNLLYPEFYVIADPAIQAKHYPFSDLLRLLYHEQAHYDEDIDNSVGNKLDQDSVHKYDYEKHLIHEYHTMVDYSGQALKDRVHWVVNAVVQLAKKVL